MFRMTGPTRCPTPAGPACKISRAITTNISDCGQFCYQFWNGSRGDVLCWIRAMKSVKIAPAERNRSPRQPTGSANCVKKHPLNEQKRKKSAAEIRDTQTDFSKTLIIIQMKFKVWWYGFTIWLSYSFVNNFVLNRSRWILYFKAESWNRNNQCWNRNNENLWIQ